MQWPQITMIVLLSMSLGAAAILHGKPRTGNYNFATCLFNTGLYVGLMYAGGFFAWVK